MSCAICPYIDGQGYFNDWAYTYNTTFESCIEASTIEVFGDPVLITRQDFTFLSGGFGVLLSILVVWAWLKAIL